MGLETSRKMEMACRNNLVFMALIQEPKIAPYPNQGLFLVRDRGQATLTAWTYRSTNSTELLESWTLPLRWWTLRTCPVWARVQKRG